MTFVEDSVYVLLSSEDWLWIGTEDSCTLGKLSTLKLHSHGSKEMSIESGGGSGRAERRKGGGGWQRGGGRSECRYHSQIPLLY